MGNIDINYYDIEELDILHINTLEDGFSEAEEKLELHLKRERDPRAVAAAKNLFKLKHNGKLFCEICNFDFGKNLFVLACFYIHFFYFLHFSCLISFIHSSTSSQVRASTARPYICNYSLFDIIFLPCYN